MKAQTGKEHISFWKCDKCGLELSFEEVCQSDGHVCENQKEDESLSFSPFCACTGAAGHLWLR